MIKPTNKNPEIDNLLTSIAGISRQDAYQRGICVWCHQQLTEFRDNLSMKEYGISGLCQTCQDETFKEVD